jgi:MFS family permease
VCVCRCGSGSLRLESTLSNLGVGNLPLEWVADTKGRKLVLSLHKINMVCTITLQVLWCRFDPNSALISTPADDGSDMLYPNVPIWALYLSGIPGLIGGNFDLGLVMLFVSYTDVMISETQRTILFFITTSMQYPAQAVGPLVSGALMDLDGQGNTPEVALFVALASAIACAVLAIFFFPETLGECQKAWAVTSNTKPDNTNTGDGNKVSRGMQDKLQQKLRTLWHDTQTSVHGVGITNMLLLSLSILTAGIGSKSIDWFALVQYPVIKFHWKFSQATTAMSVQAVITIINFAVLLPLYTDLGMQRLGLSSACTSLMIMLFSTFLLIVGSVVIGFSVTVPVFFLGLFIYTLGGGLTVVTQAYISSLSNKKNLARTLASLSLVEIGGKALASALFPTVMAAGLDDGRDWMKGLPLFTSACLFVVAGLAIVIVSTVTGEKPAQHVNVESEESSW